MLRQPGSAYVAGRSETLLKVKRFLSDAERDKPRPVGRVIAFKYQELSDGGVPRFPTYVGIRQDAPLPSSQSQPLPGEFHVPLAKTKRRFEFVKGTSNKFWEIEVEGSRVTVRFGRNGTSGQSTVQNFQGVEAAARHAEKLIREKTKKGYVEVAS